MKDNKPPFEINEVAIQKLATILNDAALTEIEYEDENHRVRLTKAGAVTMAAPAAPMTSPVIIPATQGTAARDHPGALKSPLVGTLYLSPEPGAPPFVTVGKKVNKGDTVCIIEAMKVMNPIKSPQEGIVKEIMFQDANPVEYGDILLIIE